ncbi:MAG: hypothetical protein AMJ84_07445 [Acidithiobacillales bacterium SM23_46]|nr:MAG: hypothetical protein AMS22_08250 [Thiotrichales bacterium SG8_50]KPK70689.1 MAG: hypothetical protein AMJ84_07445 [Acidithiobacillales bacterium SM23_46]KPL27188.1 MAG: hypothetical protein AMJ72_10225 [Acidithiobacillales bacterium SM1_46]
MRARWVRASRGRAVCRPVPTRPSPARARASNHAGDAARAATWRFPRSSAADNPPCAHRHARRKA